MERNVCLEELFIWGDRGGRDEVLMVLNFGVLGFWGKVKLGVCNH